MLGPIVFVEIIIMKILMILHEMKIWKLMWLMGGSTRLTAVYLVNYIQIPTLVPATPPDLRLLLTLTSQRKILHRCSELFGQLLDMGKDPWG